MASMNTRLNIKKLDGNIVQKHGTSKQVGFKQLGPGVETGFHGVQDKKIWMFGITRVPVHGQPEDIYEQISTIITEYITPKESIILNVLSTSVDFSTCESIRMSQCVDVTGQRTLVVARKQTKILKVFWKRSRLMM
ncbi:vacuolar sorting protein VPS1, dynamin [Tanacetum coccineum]